MPDLLFLFLRKQPTVIGHAGHPLAQQCGVLGMARTIRLPSPSFFTRESMVMPGGNGNDDLLRFHRVFDIFQHRIIILGLYRQHHDP